MNQPTFLVHIPLTHFFLTLIIFLRYRCCYCSRINEICNWSLKIFFVHFRGLRRVDSCWYWRETLRVLRFIKIVGLVLNIIYTTVYCFYISRSITIITQMSVLNVFDHSMSPHGNIKLAFNHYWNYKYDKHQTNNSTLYVFTILLNLNFQRYGNWICIMWWQISWWQNKRTLPGGDYS